MTATPIIPGRAYRVRFQRLALVVITSHPCQALSIALDAFAVFGGEA
ncbi:hypothetical protein G3T20_05715 [Bordetella hinzii]|nr:hypothetical protein [Bordetella hinzii]QII84241.1 hypothetical protein G3T20_05715 [Bordetella hinzii]